MKITEGKLKKLCQLTIAGKNQRSWGFKRLFLLVAELVKHIDTYWNGLWWFLATMWNSKQRCDHITRAIKISKEDMFYLWYDTDKSNFKNLYRLLYEK